MSLSRSLVQFALHFFEELLRDVREVGALGDILTDEPVGVLIGSTLPGVIRPGEEESHVSSFCNSLVFRELQTVVSSDGLLEVILLETFEDADYLVGSFRGSRVPKLSKPHLSGLPVVQREDMLGTRCPDNRIDLIITHAILPVNDFRPFGDVNPVGDCAPFLSQDSALLVPPATMAQMLVQFALVGLVPPDILGSSTKRNR